MVRHEETGSVAPIAVAVGIVIRPQAGDVAGDLGIAVRQRQVGPTPDLATAVELGAMLIEPFEVGSEPVEGLHGQQPERHGKQYASEVKNARPVEDLLLAVPLLEFEDGVHLLDGENVRLAPLRP